MSELQHSTHSTQTTRRKRGRDVQKGGVGEEFANIVPEEEKLGTIKGEKKREKRDIGKKKEERRDSGINNSILSSAGFITHHILIAFNNFS